MELELKPANYLLDDVPCLCLVAEVKNSDLPGGLATRHIASFHKDPICKIYLLGREPTHISDWQQGFLDKLFKFGGLATAVAEGMKDYEDGVVGADCYFECMRRERDRKIIAECGFLPFLTIAYVVIDDIERRVIISAYTVFDGGLDEHGITIYLSGSRWCFDDASHFLAYKANS